RQSYFDRLTLKRSCELATAIKLNESELQILGELLAMGMTSEKVAGAIFERFAVQWVAITRGARGTLVLTRQGRFEGEPIKSGQGGDAVGAGDAAAAALVHGAVRGWEWDRTVKLANILGAHVASQAGACPPHPPHIAAMAR